MIKLTGAGGTDIWFAAQHVVAVSKRPEADADGTYVWTTAGDEPFVVTEEVEAIVGMIPESRS